MFVLRFKPPSQHLRHAWCTMHFVRRWVCKGEGLLSSPVSSDAKRPSQGEDGDPWTLAGATQREPVTCTLRPNSQGFLRNLKQ